jgi:DNA-dependent RNA polymerase auxiliary subunit epsilon
MTRYTGRWTARVEQEFEIEADSEAEARELLNEEMSPPNVVELLDFEVIEFEEVTT